MPRDFKQFVRENEKTIEQNKDKAQDYEQILNKYKDMDQNGLMSALLSEASKLKREGKLNKETISSIKTTLAPFLDDKQRQMLNELVKAIDEQK